MKTRIALSLAGLAASAAFAQGAPAVPAGHAVATFGGGCFWCMEPPYDKLPGVKATISGYMGGAASSANYKTVSSGTSGHVEVLQVVYDPKVVTYEKLLEVFWVNVDPTVTDRQFCDAGPQYRPVIFVHDEAQRKAAEASRDAVAKAKTFKAPITTPIEKAAPFYAAEEYHQDYYTKNPVRYQFYRNGCGRDARLRELWGDKAGK